MINKIYKSRFCFFLEIIKWLCVIFLLILASVGSYFYRNSDLFYRVISIIIMLVFSGCIALSTSYGKLLVCFSKESYEEVRKVIWPTFREGLYATLIVILVTIIMALILWGLDSMLVYIVSFGLGL